MKHDEGTTGTNQGEPLMRALTDPMQAAAKPAGGGRAGLGQRLLIHMLRGLRVGSLDLVLPDGQRHQFTGSQPGPHGTLWVRRPQLVRHVLRAGEVGFGEAYLDGCWDSPDLTSLLRVLYRNEAHYRGPYEKNWLGRAIGWLAHQRQSRASRARENIAHHYDLGNDFYRAWLDPTMAYSSAVFDSPDQSLVEAQRNKFRRLAERLSLSAGDHLLEIGCGWGGFALFCAEQYGCRVTGITLSTEQLEEARRRAAAAGLSERVDFRLQDYREHSGRYDAIASIEMYEAIGEAHWPGYFEAIRAMLKPGGRAAIQGITIAPHLFGRYRAKRDFIQKYIFPGGMLCPPDRLQALARRAGLEPFDASFHAGDYARTLRLWHHNVLAERDAVSEAYGERFLRMWRYYLAYCECGFLSGSIDLMQIGLQRPAGAS